MRKAAINSTTIKLIHLNKNDQALSRQMAKEDKRKSQRLDYEAPVIITVEGSDSSYNGRMYNYSQGGMYFELDTPLLAETEISIIVENSTELNFKSPSRAKVKWCEEIHGAVVLYNYGAGVQYDTPGMPAKQNGILKVIQGGAGQAQSKE